MKFTIQILIIMISLSAHAQSVAQQGEKAIDFQATTIDGKVFHLSDLKGQKIFLSFFRNGSCALCNLRVHEIALQQKAFEKAKIKVIAVFESSVEDMKPYVGKQDVWFTLLSDPDGKLYQTYGVKNSPEVIDQVMKSGSAAGRIAEADAAGFKLTPQPASNFFRLPAEVLIDEQFFIQKINHCMQLTDHLPLEEVLKLGSQ